MMSPRPWLFCASIVIAARLLVADAQLNWDEELYWQVAQAWNEGGLPYVDIFDHKAPLVYVVQLVYSGFSGSIWLLRASATLVLALSAACFGLAMWPERKDLAVAFTFLVLLTLSAFGCLGANSEVLYAPYLLLTGAFLLRGSVLSAALAAAVAVNIKYPVGLDVIGVALFAISSGRLARPTAIRFFAAFAITASLVWLAFYAYFRLRGVDLIEATITVNLAHAMSERRALLGALGSYAVTRFVIVAASLGVWSLLSGARPDRSARWGLLVWAAFSLLQAVITGKTYYHYFIPVYLPLSALLVSHWRTGQRVPWRRASVTLGAVLALATLGGAAAQYGHFAKAREDLASGVCPRLRGRTVYVADELLATYRICNLRPGKFMFPPFVFQHHFVQVAGSEGLGELEAFDVVVVSPESRFAPRVRASRDGDVVELPVQP
jgi:hypothetical protein